MRAVVVASVLALVATGCFAATESSPSLTEPAPSSSTTTTEAPIVVPFDPDVPFFDEDYLWSVGDCVDLGTSGEIDLPHAPYGSRLLAECTEPHTHEVYFTATLSEDADAPFPDDLNSRLWDICYIEFAEVMGFSSSDATLNLLLYLPDSDEWASGERYHACVVYQEAADAEAYAHLFASAIADPATYRWQVSVGSCLDADELLLLQVSSIVACEEEHTFEMIGEVSLGAEDADYPGVEAIDLEATEACDSLLIDYAAQPLDDLPVLTLGQPFPFIEGEWDSGQRTVRCFAFTATQNQGLLTVTGSLGDGTFDIIFEDLDDGIQA